MNIRASGEVRAEGPNRASAATLGKMGIKNQTTSPPPHRLTLRKIIQITLGVFLNSVPFWRFFDQPEIPQNAMKSVKLPPFFRIVI